MRYFLNSATSQHYLPPMASVKTPENDRTVSKRVCGDTEEGSGDHTPPQPQPTPQNDARKSLANARHVFMSPTDAMTSPCTQQLANRRLVRKGFRPPKGVAPKIPKSKLANKENKHTVEQAKRNEAKESCKHTGVVVEPSST